MKNSHLRLILILTALAASIPADTQEERFLTSRTSPVTLTLPLEEPSFTFAVFGDRTGGPADGVKVLAQAVDDVNTIGPDLVLTVGDLVQGYNTTKPWLEQMREFKGIMGELTCEWFPVAGNHDIYWRGKNRPAGEHEGNYEEHFGPLWYAFRHKTAWFLVLYSDEGDPETGEKNFHRPASQRMSAEQYTWLDETLNKTQEAEHVFVFLHHPRWKPIPYGRDWERVHTRLVEARNVSAVFAGHIHAMTYDGPRDGIEYFTLATVGGSQGGAVPEAGFLHQFDLVTVRKDGIDVASIPVGGVTNPRTITSKLAFEAERVRKRFTPSFDGLLMPCVGATEPETITVTLKNPVKERLSVTLSVASSDPRRWSRPDHRHFMLNGRASIKATFEFHRGPDAALDGAFRLPQLVVATEYLADDLRIRIPERRFTFPASSAGLAAPEPSVLERSLALDGEDESCLAVASDSFELPDGAFTIEGWGRFDGFQERQGFITKTENAEFGLFVGDGKPAFFVHLDGRYATAESKEPSLPRDEWTHLAGVFDGKELRLYVAGELIARGTASGSRTRNELPLIIGGDVNSDGRGTSLQRGHIDEVRVSSVARYTGESFEPQRRFEPDGETVLLLHMDAASGPWLFDSSESQIHAERRGKARVE